MPADPANQPAAYPAQTFSLAEMARIIGAAVVAGTAIGYLLAYYDHETLRILARIFASVAMVSVVLMIFESRRRCNINRINARLDRIEALLSRDAYWRTYTDVMRDLGGIDGESSGDISIDRHRP